MSNTPEVPLPAPEIQKPAETQSEIPQAVEQGIPAPVHQQPQQMPRPQAQASVSPAKTQSVPTVTVPADPAQLTQLAKGNPTNAITWFANFWLRIIKKAVAIGSNVMTSQSINIPAPSNSTSSNSVVVQDTSAAPPKTTQAVEPTNNILQPEGVDQKF